MGANTSKPPVPAPAGASAQTNIRNSGKAPWWNVLGVTKRNSVNSGGPKNTNRGPAPMPAPVPPPAPMPAPVPPPAPMPAPVPAAAVGGRRKKKASRLSKKRSSKKRASRKSRS
jgi:hypothetical protein